MKNNRIVALSLLCAGIELQIISVPQQAHARATQARTNAAQASENTVPKQPAQAKSTAQSSSSSSQNIAQLKQLIQKFVASSGQIKEKNCISKLRDKNMNQRQHQIQIDLAHKDYENLYKYRTDHKLPVTQAQNAQVKKGLKTLQTCKNFRSNWHNNLSN